MPREYITRLVLDKNHVSMAIVKRGLQVVGGITYRPFNKRKFAEIVFCAIDSSQQVKVSRREGGVELDEGNGQLTLADAHRGTANT